MRNIEKDELEMAARREEMISAGFRIFSEKGIEATGMQEIANACHVGIATLYRYYKTKLELVLDIGTRKWREFSEQTKKKRSACNVERMTAAEEFVFYLNLFIDLYKNNKELLRFNQNFNVYVIHEHAAKEQLLPYLKEISVMKMFFHELYEKGKQDGTIKTDLTEDKMFASTVHIMLAVGVRYSEGLLYSSENETDNIKEFEFLKKIMLKEFVNDTVLVREAAK